MYFHYKVTVNNKVVLDSTSDPKFKGYTRSDEAFRAGNVRAHDHELENYILEVIPTSEMVHA